MNLFRPITLALILVAITTMAATSATAASDCKSVQTLLHNGKVDWASKLPNLRICAFYIAQALWRPKNASEQDRERARGLIKVAIRYIDPISTPKLSGQILAFFVESVAAPERLEAISRDLRRYAPREYARLEGIYKLKAEEDFKACQADPLPKNQCDLDANPWVHLKTGPGETRIEIARNLAKLAISAAPYVPQKGDLTLEQAHAAQKTLNALAVSLRNPSKVTSKKLEASQNRIKTWIKYHDAIDKAEIGQNNRLKHYCDAKIWAENDLKSDPRNAKRECDKSKNFTDIEKVLGSMTGDRIPSTNQIKKWLSTEVIAARPRLKSALHLVENFRPCQKNSSLHYFESAGNCLSFIQEIKKKENRHVREFLEVLLQAADSRRRSTVQSALERFKLGSSIRSQSDIAEMKSTLDELKTNHKELATPQALSKLQDRVNDLNTLAKGNFGFTFERLREIGLGALYVSARLKETFCDPLGADFPRVKSLDLKSAQAASIDYREIRQLLRQNEIDYFSSCLVESELFSRNFISYAEGWAALIAQETIKELELAPVDTEKWQRAKRFLSEQTSEEELHGAAGKSPFTGDYRTWPKHRRPDENSKPNVDDRFDFYRELFQAGTKFIDAGLGSDVAKADVSSAIEILQRPNIPKLLPGWEKLEKHYHDFIATRPDHRLSIQGIPPKFSPPPPISELKIAPICREPTGSNARSESDVQSWRNECMELVGEEEKIDLRIWQFIMSLQTTWRQNIQSPTLPNFTLQNFGPVLAEDIRKNLQSIQQRYFDIGLDSTLLGLLKTRFDQKVELVKNLGPQNKLGTAIQMDITEKEDFLLQIQLQLHQQNPIAQIFLQNTNIWTNKTRSFRRNYLHIVNHDINLTIRKFLKDASNNKNASHIKTLINPYLELIKTKFPETTSIRDFNNIFRSLYWHIYTISGERGRKIDTKISSDEIRRALNALKAAKVDHGAHKFDSLPPSISLLWYSLRLIAEPSEDAGNQNLGPDGGGG
jgi:hypothetical protein